MQFLIKERSHAYNPISSENEIIKTSNLLDIGTIYFLSWISSRVIFAFVNKKKEYKTHANFKQRRNSETICIVMHASVS